jgi:hypothetical protein
MNNLNNLNNPLTHWSTLKEKHQMFLDCDQSKPIFDRIKPIFDWIDQLGRKGLVDEMSPTRYTSWNFQAFDTVGSIEFRRPPPQTSLAGTAKRWCAFTISFIHNGIMEGGNELRDGDGDGDGLGVRNADREHLRSYGWITIALYLRQFPLIPPIAQCLLLLSTSALLLYL